MKWLFLINNASFFAEFFAKIANQLLKDGDECIFAIDSKIAEYERNKVFPKGSRVISRIDWCIKNYDNNRKDFNGLTWKEIFPIYGRFDFINLNYNFKKCLEIVNQSCQFFDYVFEKEMPDVIVSEPPAGLFHLIAYDLCRKKNKPYLGLCSSKFNNRTDVYNSKFTNSEFEKVFKKIDNDNISQEEKDFAQDFAKKFISHEQLPLYVGLGKISLSQLDIAKHYGGRIKKMGFLLMQYWKKRKYFKNYDYESEAILKRSLQSFFRMEKRQLRILSQKIAFCEIKNSENFFLFPLHFQPESSTLVYATYYNDQLNTVRNIALSLPFPYKLCVKEHPASIGSRSSEFYKEMAKIPNVEMVSPSADVKDLVEKSVGVIVLTSTIGFEAALAGKPVYILGDVFYSYHPLCRKVINFSDLGLKIQKDLLDEPKSDNLIDINNRFIVSYFRNTIEGNIVSSSLGEDTNDYKSICGGLRAILNNK